MALARTLRRWLALDLERASESNVKQPLPVDAILRETNPDQALKIMVAEVADLTRAMREFLIAAERYVYFGGLIAGAALTVGLMRYHEGRNWMVLVFAPYAIGLTFIYLMQLFTEVERRAGYKRYLEEQVRNHLGSAILLESEIGSWKARTRFSTLGVQGIYAVAFLGLTYLSARETGRHQMEMKGPEIFGLHFLSLHYLNLALLAFNTLVVAAAVVENLRASGRSYEVASGYVLPSKQPFLSDGGRKPATHCESDGPSD